MWEWNEGDWRDLVEKEHLTLLQSIPLDVIGSPWSWNIHQHLNYDRLFWSIHKDVLRTPLLLRPWSTPFKGERNIGCKSDGNRLDNASSPTYTKPPKYELVLGNMRYCAIYTQGYETAPCLLLPDSEHDLDIQELWDKYHNVMEGNYYDNPDYGMPNKFNNGFTQGN